jgi:hypothetical protein
METVEVVPVIEAVDSLKLNAVGFVAGAVVTTAVIASAVVIHKKIQERKARKNADNVVTLKSAT